jgi:DNA polymerase III epsilon subunit-like protein
MAARYGNNRVGYLDIECDNLDADFGIVLSWTLKERDNEELHSATISKEDVELSIELDKEVTDRRILQELQPLLGQFDYIVCHYGAMDRGLDIRFLRTRFVKLGLKFPVYGQMYAIDTFLMSKYKFKLHSNRLDTIAEYFGCPYQKTELKGDVWTLAKKGSSKALRYILDHNQKDVLILEWVHKKLEPYANLSKRSI